MSRRRSSKNYTLQPYVTDSETGILFINFRADNLVAAKAQAMIYVRNEAFLEGIKGVKLLRNNAEVWRWTTGSDI